MACMLATGVAWAGPSDVTDPEAPRSLPADGPVDVRWTDPAQFTEIRRSGNRREARRGDWVHDLAEYLRKRASDRLPDGQRLEVTITDIARAGNYEPWHGINADSIRFMRSEEHTSELQSLMRISYAVFCLKKKNTTEHIQR